MRFPILAALALAAGCERRTTTTCPPADRPEPAPGPRETLIKANGRWQLVETIPPQNLPIPAREAAK